MAQDIEIIQQNNKNVQELNKIKKITLIGSPNVGKSVIFGALTGQYVTISNYPGTTVEITQGKARINDIAYEIKDTPGAYSLLPITEEEEVTRLILLQEKPDILIHVLDAKNINKSLHLTLQLIEAGFPVLLDLNIMDEAKNLGVSIDINELEIGLNIPVVSTIATDKEGLANLKDKITEYTDKERIEFKYDHLIENAIHILQPFLKDEYNISGRAMALMILQEDPKIMDLIKNELKEDFHHIENIIKKLKQNYEHPLTYVITVTRQEFINKIIEKAVEYKPMVRTGVAEILSKLMMHPLTGIPIFIAIVYMFYQFVGVFGAQIAVNFLENSIFDGYINPFVTKLIVAIIPSRTVQELFVYDYGIITLGIRYAIALILPIVTTFFIAFSIIEDTGYLPRLAMLIDRIFKKIGLNGRAVIPMVLGFGCDTMATIVTRTLETRREKIIATFLLSLAIPCSAQIGVILALLSGNSKALWIFIFVMSFIFLFVGYLTSKLLPGEKSIFYMEISPLRMPKLSNIFMKTYTRAEWYFKEILPMFILASIFIWIGKLSGLFDLLINLISYPVSWIGLPNEVATAFLFGFFRRDFGAAGLYDLKNSGILSGIPLVVSTVTMALFMPCIAQLSVAIKERGWKMAFAMGAFIFPFSLFVGYMVNLILNLLGVKI